MNEIITMSTKEASRISILEKLKAKHLKQGKAARILDISVRQVRRLFVQYRLGGAAALTHKLRGIPSNNKANPEVLETAMMTITHRYHDFSVTLAHEKLVAHHGFPYSRETLRGAMMTVGIWTPKRQPTPVIHEMRERRASEGELVQADGSPHAWFEDRGPACTLLVYVDDATGKLLHLEFVKSETTNAYFGATKRYLQNHGKPLALYVDRHGVFRVNTTKALSARVEDSNGRTQFGRAMEELGIELIHANSPEAKGRVEKVNHTLQDRLVKELRLQGVSTMEEANRFLPVFMADFNRKFAVVARSPVNLHRPLTREDHLEEILVQKHTRRLSKQLTLSYERRVYQIVTDHPTYAMRHATVIVQEDAQENITIWYKEAVLTYRMIVKQPRSSIVDTKQVTVIVDRIAQSAQQLWKKPAVHHPWRQAARLYVEERAFNTTP